MKENHNERRNYMKIIIIRHGDPNYEIDSLTPTGWEEAELLAERIAKLDVKDFYVSPLGRAQATASVTLKKTGRTGETLPWLREFLVPVVKPYETEPDCAWDWLPAVWTKEENFFDRFKWTQHEAYEKVDLATEAKRVTDSLDELLASHGYRREGNYYRAENANEDTIVFFCHFGLECLLLGHLLNISPVLLWQGTCAAPTSVTTIVTEEREKGIAYFRMSAFGDISHLYAAGKEPSFSARFCETYDNPNQRHN